MRLPSSEPSAREPADVRACAARVARFSPTERASAREPAGAVAAEIAAESEIEGVLRAETVRDEVAAATPAVG